MRRLIILSLLVSMVLAGEEIVVRRIPIDGVPLEEVKVKKTAEKEKFFPDETIKTLEVSEPKKIEEGFVKSGNTLSDGEIKISEPKKIEENFIIKARNLSILSEGPDLTPYQPPRWSSPLVCSRVSGDTTATTDDTLLVRATTYVKFAIANIGTEYTPLRQFKITVDGNTVVDSWGPIGVDPGSYRVLTVGFKLNTSGEYTVTMIADSKDEVDELNEDNNTFSLDYCWSGPDLTPYQPTGWSAPLVCSRSSGDTTATPADTLAIGVTTSAKLAIANVGTEWTPLRQFKITVDGNTVVDSWGPIGVDPGSYCVLTQGFKVNISGKHTVTMIADSKEEVYELDEDNNTFSLDYYWESGPDLVPYTPNGWSAPIVCSTAPGNTTAGDTLAVGVPTHVSFAVKNLGNETASGIYLAIFVDEDLVVEVEKPSEELSSDSYAVFDTIFTVNTPGEHTVTYEVDYGDHIDDEINEGNNIFSVDCYWASGPDLIPYKPDGWSAPIVCSTVPGDTVGGGNLAVGDTTYVNFAVKNVGNETASGIYLAIFVDEDLVVEVEKSSEELEYGSYAVFDTMFIGDSPVENTVTYRVDYGDHLDDELNEGNNAFSVDYYWRSPDLTPYTPEGWYDAIVASAVPGTHTHDLPPLFAGATTYIDWAVINDGDLDIPSSDTFYTYLYSYDSSEVGVPLQGWYFAGLDVGDYVSVEDWEYSFNAGQHTLTLFADSMDAIIEGNEENNHASCDYFWNESDWGGGGTWYADSAEYIIITCDSLVDAFEPLAHWKTKKGVYAKIVTVEDICANFSGDHTRDDASKIRNFIYEARESGALYILLGGQCDFEHGEEIVPRRDAFAPCGSDDYPDEDTIPCDLYYSDLTRNWDMDFDGVYGEKGIYGDDAVDIYSDIFVGRAPVKNTRQVENFISKVITYEKNPNPDYIKKIYLPQGFLFEDNPGEQINDTIAEIIEPYGWQISKQYQTGAGAAGIDETVVSDSMNSGFNLQHWVGHGMWYGVFYGDGRPGHWHAYYDSDDPPNNTNDSTKASIISSITCLAGAVDYEDNSENDYDCLAERIVNVNKHAGVAAIMNTRYGWTENPTRKIRLSDRLCVNFHKKLFETPAYHLGEVVSAAKNAMANGDRKVLYAWTLFGDPEMPVWTDVPLEVEVSYDANIDIGSQTIAINVRKENSQVPVGNAYVCLWKENEVYKRDTTNENGNLSLEVTPTTPGFISITVTKENMLPYEGEIIVQKDLVLQNITVEIDSSANYEAVNSITAAGDATYFTIEGNGTIGGNVSMQTGNYISLLPGFEAQEGCIFDAYIDNTILSDEYITTPIAFNQKPDSNGIKPETEEEKQIEPIPTVFSCAQNYPNPFMHNTTIKYGLPKDVNVSLEIYNLIGQKVKTLVNGQQSAGYKSVSWDGRTSGGAQVPQGIYFYVFKAGDFTKHHKMILLK